MNYLEKNFPNAENNFFPTIPQENYENGISKIESEKNKYREIISLREEKYNHDVMEYPAKENERFNLNTHNNIVLDYAFQISDKEALSPQEKVTAIIAVIMHDSGKLSSALIKHHEKGSEYAEEMLRKILGSKIDGIEIDEKMINKVKEAIVRHMNHPFVVMMNKGERFPAPQDKIDKTVFDADMLANIGFKNVAFRIGDENMLAKDALRAQNQNILEESFRNVLEGETSNDGKKIPGANGLKNEVCLDSSRKIAENLINSAERILEYLKKENTINKLQKEFSDEAGNFNLTTIKEKGGIELLKKMLNEEIEKSSISLGINIDTCQKFKM